MSSTLLRNHIAKHFLESEERMMEILKCTYPKEYEIIATTGEVAPAIIGLYSLLNNDGQKAYYCTKSLLDKLDLLKVSRKDGSYDWSVFKKISDRKLTFILPNNALLRVMIVHNTISFIHINLTEVDIKKNHAMMKWVMFYINRFTGEQCDHFNHMDVKTKEDFIYKLLCFMFLSENEEVILMPNQKSGTKKSGKIINQLKVPLTIVDSKWNITSINNTGFDVSGHFRLQPYGVGMQETKMIFIEPFRKNGYVRKAKSEQ